MRLSQPFVWMYVKIAIFPCRWRMSSAWGNEKSRENSENPFFPVRVLMSSARGNEKSWKKISKPETLARHPPLLRPAAGILSPSAVRARRRHWIQPGWIRRPLPFRPSRDEAEEERKERRWDPHGWRPSPPLPLLPSVSLAAGSAPIRSTTDVATPRTTVTGIKEHTGEEERRRDPCGRKAEPVAIWIREEWIRMREWVDF